MAIVRVNIRDHYGIGELWSDAENETAAIEEMRRWCEAHSPWELRTLTPERGDDGHYKFTVEREVGPKRETR
ncbi:MAG: hypothetical protein HY321_10950 [Armatimonadetes bacterium]|nr:hypothetical protein [Armatimonadota bacterium]